MKLNIFTYFDSLESNIFLVAIAYGSFNICRPQIPEITWLVQ